MLRNTPAGEPSPAFAVLESVTVTPYPSVLAHAGAVAFGDAVAVAEAGSVPLPAVAGLPLEPELHPAAARATMTPHVASPKVFLVKDFPSLARDDLDESLADARGSTFIGRLSGGLVGDTA